MRAFGKDIIITKWMVPLVIVLIVVSLNGIGILWGNIMKKIYLWIKKRIKCWNEGHDWYYSEYANYWFCKRCGKATKIPYWFKEE